MSFFVVPIEGSGSDSDPRRPKYVPALGVAWAIVDFHDTALCWANCSVEQEAAVAANPDVVLVPALDNAIGAGALSQVQVALEARNLPSQWVTAGMTYRQVLRVLVGMAQLVQFVRDQRAQPLVIAGHLDDTFNSLPVGIRNALTDGAAALNIDTSGLTGASTVRQILYNFGQQCAAGLIPIRLGDL